MSETQHRFRLNQLNIELVFDKMLGNMYYSKDFAYRGNYKRHMKNLNAICSGIFPLRANDP